MLSSLAFKCVFLAKKLDINFFKVILNIKVVKSAFINRLENLSRIEQIGITVLSFFIIVECSILLLVFFLSSNNNVNISGITPFLPSLYFITNFVIKSTLF